MLVDEIAPLADIWSFAAVLLHCLTGKAPFDGVKDMDVLKALRRGQLPGMIPSSLPQPLQSLLAECFCTDPARRPSLQAIQQVSAQQDFAYGFAIYAF